MPGHKTIANALFAAQGEIPDIQKNAVNPHFKNRYVSLDELLDKVLPVLKNNGILFLQQLSSVGETPAIKTSFILESTGEAIEDTSPLVLGKVGPQDWGSSITYARRYALMSALGLVADEDDDAEKASTTTTRSTDKATPSKPTQGSYF